MTNFFPFPYYTCIRNNTGKDFDFMEKSLSVFSEKEGDFSFKKGLFIAVFTFLLAVSPLFGKLSPFPAPVMGALSGFSCVCAFFGAVTGYAVTGNFALAVPQIAAMTLILAVRLISGEHRGRISVTITALITGISIFLANLPSAESPSDIFTAFAFGIVVVASVFCADSFRSAKDKPVTADNIPLLLSGAVIYTMLITAFTGLQFEMISLGILLSAVCIVISPFVMPGLAPAVGILSATGIAICDKEYSSVAIILTLSSLLVSLLSGYGRITRACVLIFSAGAGVIVTEVTAHSAVCLCSLLAGSVLAMVVPESLIPSFHNRCRADVAASSLPFHAFGRRLSGMGNAIGEMNSAIRKTAEVLDRENIHDPSEIYISAAENICRGCCNHMHCWGEYYNRSADIMNKAVLSIRAGQLADENMLTGHFSEICHKKRELVSELNRGYASFCSARSAARKIGEMRSILSSQLSSTQLMLEKAAEELCCESCIDYEAAEKAGAVLRENGLISPAVTAMNIDGRLTVDAYGDDSSVFNAENIGDKLSFALRREFDPPMVAENGGQVHITLSERSLYDAQIKIFSRSKPENAHSGDTCECFNDGLGNVYMILSDGMGSGSRARIDSAFSCSMLARMLKAGIDFDASMEMLNTSLMVKSSDESFATMDVCRINLYNGEISLYKAGSASTFVRCGNEFAELQGDGMPLGVETDANYSEKRFTAAAGDVIIMASDGAEIDRKWLCNILMRDRHPDLDAIIDTIGEALRLSAEKGKEDDITVIGVKIVK